MVIANSDGIIVKNSVKLYDKCGKCGRSIYPGDGIYAKGMLMCEYCYDAIGDQDKNND